VHADAAEHEQPEREDEASLDDEEQGHGDRRHGGEEARTEIRWGLARLAAAASGGPVPRGVRARKAIRLR